MNAEPRLPPLPSARKIQDLIQVARSLDAAGATVSDYRTILDQLLTGYGFVTAKTSDGSYYRCRLNSGETLFRNLSELWAPPANLVTKFGRANEIGSSVLYLSECGSGALREMPLSSGDVVTVVEYKVKPGHHLNLQEVGMLEHVTKPTVKELATTISQSVSAIYGGNPSSIERRTFVRKFLVEEYTKRVPAGAENQYKLTVAISELMLCFEPCDGLVYPGIGNDLKDVNVALKLERAAKKLKPVRVDVIRVGQVNWPEISVGFLRAADEFDQAGAIFYGSAFKRPNWIQNLPPIVRPEPPSLLGLPVNLD